MRRPWRSVWPRVATPPPGTPEAELRHLMAEDVEKRRPWSEDPEEDRQPVAFMGLPDREPRRLGPVRPGAGARLAYDSGYLQVRRTRASPGDSRSLPPRAAWGAPGRSRAPAGRRNRAPTVWKSAPIPAGRDTE